MKIWTTQAPNAEKQSFIELITQDLFCKHLQAFSNGFFTNAIFWP